MGQTQSDEYQCDSKIKDATADEINSREPQDSSVINRHFKNNNNAIGLDDQHVRKLSAVSHRNVQLLSMKPRGDRDSYADDLKCRRRSSLINLILGAPSSGPKFSDDLCSIKSMNSFGIEFFPDNHLARYASEITIESIEGGDKSELTSVAEVPRFNHHKHRRGSSIGSLQSVIAQAKKDRELGGHDMGDEPNTNDKISPSIDSLKIKRELYRHASNQQSTLASIDLRSSFDKQDKTSESFNSRSIFDPSVSKSSRQAIFEGKNSFYEHAALNDLKKRLAKGRVNQSGRILKRVGSELSLYSTISGSSGGSSTSHRSISHTIRGNNYPTVMDSLKETKRIIISQVCLPFILAGFGNMAAGLVLSSIARWRAFTQVPAFFVLLPPLVGLKGNIEMTLASRLSTLSNLNLLDSNYQRRRAYLTNLVLVLGQAIALSLFAATISILCDYTFDGKSRSHVSVPEQILVVMATGLASSFILVLLSSLVVSLSICLAHVIQVNPDNLSTLTAALYGDVSSVLIYGLIADWMLALVESNLMIWPLAVLCCCFVLGPILFLVAHKLEETNGIAISSMPPMLVSILISMGSGSVLAMVVDRFKLIALFQPVVNGFSANLIAVQASRVSTWLWCSALRNIPSNVTGRINLINGLESHKKAIGASLASFIVPPSLVSSQKLVSSDSSDSKVSESKVKSLVAILVKVFKTLLWSFFNPSPNAVAARLLLIMLVPAHTLYFFVIRALSPPNYVVITWQFFTIYLSLCVFQVFILLAVCEPLLTTLMKRRLDPDIFGISTLMALADLTGTLCLTSAFFILAAIGDVNAM